MSTPSRRPDKSHAVRWWLMPVVMFMVGWLVWAWLGYPR